MAYFLFMDESGQDRHDSPYEVLAGIAIEDNLLWNFIREANKTEEDIFGLNRRELQFEIKAAKFLTTRVFKQAAKHPPFSDFQRRVLSSLALQNGAMATSQQISALAQAKLEYVKRILLLCVQYRFKVFASIIESPENFIVDGELLRKDYN